MLWQSVYLGMDTLGKRIFTESIFDYFYTATNLLNLTLVKARLGLTWSLIRLTWRLLKSGVQ